VKVYQLPHDLSAGLPVPEGEVVIRAYHSNHNALKNRIVLHQNMINLLVSGTKTVVNADGRTTVHEDELLVLSTGNCLTTEVRSGHTDFSSIILYCSNEALTDFFVKYAHLDGQVPDHIPADQPFLVFKQDAFIVHYRQSLDLLLKRGEPMSKEMKQLKLEELLLHLLLHDPRRLKSLKRMAKNDEDLQMRKAMEGNVRNSITIEELAFLCNCSLSTFKRRFAKIYGTSPQKWLLEQKMQVAAGLLRHPDERPGRVYLKVGYEDHSSFSKSFKLIHGMTPKEFQAQNGERPTPDDALPFRKLRQ